MEHHLLVIVALLVALSLVGCAATSQAGSVDSLLRTAALPDTMQLVAGTLQLEGTTDAVDAVQAAELAFLWQAYGALEGQDGTADAELAALLDQIEAAMTPGQLSAIAALSLDAESVQSLAAELGVDASAGAQAGATTAADATQSGVLPPDAGGAAFGSEGGGMPDWGSAPDAASDLTASASPSQGQDALLGGLVEALVAVLQARA